MLSQQKCNKWPCVRKSKKTLLSVPSYLSNKGKHMSLSCLQHSNSEDLLKLQVYCAKIMINYYLNFPYWLMSYWLIFFSYFFHFSKIHRGDPYDYDQNRKGPPYEFWKNEKKMQKFFFFNLIPDIKMYAKTINKNDFRIFLT